MPKQSIKSLGASLERQVLDLARSYGLDATRQPASGRYEAHHGDLILSAPDGPDLLAECKVRALWTDAQGAQTLRVDLGWLDKVVSEASAQGLDGAVVLVRPKGNRKAVLALLDADLFLRLLSRFRVPDPLP